MKTLKFIVPAFILGAIILGLAQFVGIGPRPAKAQTCNIGGYVGAFQIAQATSLVFTISGTGAHYQPQVGGFAAIYSDGTVGWQSTKIDGSGPAKAVVYSSFQGLYSTTQP